MTVGNVPRRNRIAALQLRHKSLVAGLFALFFILAAIIMWPAAALAQPPDADVDFYLVPGEDGAGPTVGDHIVLRLEVSHPADSSVELPVLDETWGQFEVVGQTRQETTQTGNGMAKTHKDIIVTLFEPGQYQTPPLLVTHHKTNDTVEELGAPVIPLNVDSVLVEGDTELRDLKEQANLPAPPLWPFILAGVLLAAVASGGAFWAGRWAYNRWLRKTPQPLVPQPVIDPRPPEVIAYAELERIEGLNLPARGQFKEHYSLITDCLRRYIEGRYDIPALEQTTAEFRAAVARSAVSVNMAREFIDLFSRSDLVKFARFKPDADEAYELLDEARTLVEATTPMPQAEPEPGSTPPRFSGEGQP